MAGKFTLPGGFLSGTHASRPAASAVAAGAIYAETDTGQSYQSDGVSSWTAWGAPAGGTPSGSITASGYTQSTGKLLGRSTASTGAIEEITVGTNLTLSGGTLSASGGVSGGILAVTCYYPASPADYPITSASMADVDAANLAVTFTAPASGNVVVRCAVTCLGSSGFLALGLRESTTTIGQTILVNVSNTRVERGTAEFCLTGVSAGSHTYKLAAMMGGAGGTGHIYVDQVGDGPATMVVEAAP